MGVTEFFQFTHHWYAPITDIILKKAIHGYNTFTSIHCEVKVILVKARNQVEIEINKSDWGYVDVV